jgi:Fe-S cluster assembly ATPase SufC
MSEEEAVALIVNGFVKDVIQQLPMEFAVEAQKLIGISLEGSVPFGKDLDIVVHVLSKGKIVKTGDKDLALELEKNGYADIINAAA